MSKMIGLAFFYSILATIAIQTGAQRYFIIAPNIIRVDVDESILINLAGIPDGEAIPVTLYFLMTGSNERLSEKTVNVIDSTYDTIRISREQLHEQETKGNKFITLVAQSSSPQIQFENRKLILLSFKSGFVFIQTDKPLYTPSQRVDIRIIALNQQMFPDGNRLQVDIATPDNIVVQRVEKVAEEGFVSMQFDFPPVPVFGNWTVNVYHGHLFKANSSVQFEVKEYVLPKFYVTVQTHQEYILPETMELTTQITAKYVFGEPVYGQYHINFGVFADDGNFTTLQEVQGTLSDRGFGFKDFKVNELEVDLETLMGKRLIIQAFVTDSATGETINANNTRVAFTRTPYRFNWDNTPRFFKRGLPFAVKARVQYINGLPAANVPVEVTATARLSNGNVDVLEGAMGPAGRDAVTRITELDGEVYFRLDVPSTATSVIINLQTTDEALNEANTESTFTVQPEESASGEFLLVRLPSGQVTQTQQIGSISPIEVQLTNANVDTLHYFVVSGGKIVYKNRKQALNANSALGFQITHKMAPLARVVAYYINAGGHVISDALLIQVERKCENPIRVIFTGLEKNGDTFLSNRMEEDCEMQISAKEHTKIGLLAVDEAVFTLRKYHRLTQKKVFDRMAGYDLGCGPGGGQTSAAIFKDAGVTVLTNAILDVVQREELLCPEAVVRRRRLSEEDNLEILNEYDDEEEREYCKMGLRDVKDPESFPCIRRAKLLARRMDLDLESPQIRVFYDCCTVNVDKGRSGNNEDPISVDLDNVMVRSYFPESWMILVKNTGDSKQVRHQFTLPHSVTTWVIEAVGVSLSNQYLMCVADPVKLQVRPLFFLELGLPYSVQRMEQIEIVVTVFNYAEEDLSVTVYLKGVEGLCSLAQPGEYSQGITIQVLSKRPASVKYVIVPLEAKSFPIEVYAITESSEKYKDAVRKYLNVRLEGYTQRDTVTITMDPVNSRDLPRNTEEGGRNQSYRHTQLWGGEGENNQNDIIRYTLNGDAIPGTHKVHVSLMGNVMGNVIETVIKGLDKLLIIPSGCGEQTMLFLGPNIYVYRYLRHTDQFTADLEVSSKQFIENGVTRELTFNHPDGSFSVSSNSAYPSSTWLTAFVSKVFCQAFEFAFIDKSVTCKAMEWLIGQTQNDDGSFREVYRVHHQVMTGGVQGSASLTAYVLISLLECECATVDKTDSVAAATAFLELQLPALTRPYAIAITTYALTLANSISKDDALIMLIDIAIYDGATNSRHWGSDDSSFGGGPKPYWYSSRPKAIEVETTSYALLALLEMDDMQYSHAIVNWLTDQQNYQGGFASTQDTVIALQALSEYAIKSEMNIIDINCQVTCQEAQYEDVFLLKPGNAIVRQFADIPLPAEQQEFRLHFDSSGTGMGQLKFESSYNIPEPNSENCDFELVINMEERDDQDKHHIEYNIQVNYLEGEVTGMAIIDVGLFTGYQPVEQDLEAVKTNSGDNIQLVEVSDRSVVFYLDEIREDRVEEITFRAERIFNVGKVQPVPVHVYDYYNPTIECIKFTHPKEGSSQLSRLCEGDICICASGNCAQNPFFKTKDYNVDDLQSKACESQSHFAYEVEVMATRRSGNFQYIIMHIVAPLKLGLDLVTKGENRTFWKSRSCDEPKLIKTKKYLVIGTGGLKMKDKMGQPGFKYIIDERMSFYIWPFGNKLNINKWERIANKLKTLKQKLVAGSGCDL